MVQKGRVLETLEEVVKPEHTALLVYDAMKAVLGLGDGPRPPGGSLASVNVVPNMIPRWKKLIGAARQAGVRIVYTYHQSRWEDMSGPWRKYTMKLRGAKDEQELSQWANAMKAEHNAIAEELAPTNGDLVLQKCFNSAFSGTPLDSILRAWDTKAIVLTGVMTESGIETTARQAVILGYYSVIPTDCVNSRVPERHQASLAYLARCADLCTVEQLLAIWAR